MILLILAVLLLFVVQTILPGSLREPMAGSEDPAIKRQLHNHDIERPLTLKGQRAVRAVHNMQEALPVFLTVALLNMMVGAPAPLAVMGATVFLIARIVYVGVYLAGIGMARSLVWFVSWIGLGMMVTPLIQYL